MSSQAAIETVKLSKWSNGTAIIAMTREQAKRVVDVEDGRSLRAGNVRVLVTCGKTGFLHLRRASAEEDGMSIRKRDDFESPFEYMVGIPRKISGPWPHPIPMMEVRAQWADGRFQILPPPGMEFVKKMSKAKVVPISPSISARALAAGERNGMFDPAPEPDLDELRKALDVVNRYATMPRCKVYIDTAGKVAVDVTVTL